MANFVIECPVCGKPVQAGTGLFSKKQLRCACGYVINVNSERITKDTCPHCGNDVIYDRTKKDSATCPVCHTKIYAGTEKIKLKCPSCQTELMADKNAKTYTCPQCKSLIDVQATIAKANSSGKTSVIKWDMGMNDIFVYRHPVENFNIGSQLIVSEGQKALFFRNGKGLDVFGPGRHILETQKLPLLEDILKFPTDADLTFDSKVYFARTNRLRVKWGIPELPLRNPGMNFYVKIGFSGSCEVQLLDDNESVRKLVYMIRQSSAGENTEPVAVGGEEKYTSQYLSEKFRDVITTRLSTMMTNFIQVNNINILDIESQKTTISEFFRNDLNKVFSEYGLKIPPMLFNVTAIRMQRTPEVEQWIRQEAERVTKVREQEVLQAEAEAARGRILVEEQTEAQRKILRTQGAGEETKITAAAESEAVKLGAQGEAEAVRLTGQASAESYSAQAMAEAEEMRAKGYTYGQETARQIGLEAMQNGLPGTGEGAGGAAGGIGSAMGDMIGLGVGLGAMGEVASMTKGMISPIMSNIKNAGDIDNGQAPPPSTNKVAAWNCSCGRNCITSKFCPECGAAKPESDSDKGWDCTCGCKHITSNFCPDCGAKRPETPAAWTCPSCGKEGITTNFCPDCGQRRNTGEKQ